MNQDYASNNQIEENLDDDPDMPDEVHYHFTNSIQKPPSNLPTPDYMAMNGFSPI